MNKRIRKLVKRANWLRTVLNPDGCPNEIRTALWTATRAEEVFLFASGAVDNRLVDLQRHRLTNKALEAAGIILPAKEVVS